MADFSINENWRVDNINPSDNTFDPGDSLYVDANNNSVRDTGETYFVLGKNDAEINKLLYLAKDSIPVGLTLKDMSEHISRLRDTEKWANTGKGTKPAHWIRYTYSYITPNHPEFKLDESRILDKHNEGLKKHIALRISETLKKFEKGESMSDVPTSFHMLSWDAKQIGEEAMYLRITLIGAAVSKMNNDNANFEIYLSEINAKAKKNNVQSKAFFTEEAARLNQEGYYVVAKTMVLIADSL